jgi:hypothetical protein
MTKLPDDASDELWTLHALNIHGDFFERKCRQVVKDLSPLYELTTTNYPVNIGHHQSELDIRADLTKDGTQLIVLIECKKNNPEFVQWVFFPRDKQSRAIELPTVNQDNAGLQVTPFEQAIVIADTGRETRGTYRGNKQGDKTKTSNAAITDASGQISLATLAIQKTETLRAQAYKLERKLAVIVPLIVTTADLLLCWFSPNDVGIDTGELLPGKGRFTKEPFVVYEYALPAYLHEMEGYALSQDTMERYVRRHIVIVNSAHLSHFLSTYAVKLAGMSY